MRRILAAALAGLLALGLCACDGPSAGQPTAPPEGTAPPAQTAAAETPFTVDGTTKALLDSGAYTDVEDMSPPIEAAVIFDLLDESSVTAGDAYASTYTAELAAVVVFADEAAAEAGEAVLRRYIQSQLTAERDYRPAEAAKLEKAILERRGNTVALAVANDAMAAQAVLAGWGK